MIANVASVDSVGEGDAVTFTVTVTNLGPTAATNVTAGDTLDSGLRRVSSTTTPGTTYDTTGKWAIGNLPVDTSRTLTITATANAGTANTWKLNRAGVLATEVDSVLSNNVAFDSVRVKPAAPPPPPGADEPADPGSGYLFADDFDRYASVIAMLSPGNCAAGTDGFGVPSAYATYGNRTRPNTGGAGTCNAPAGYSLVTGRGGSGNALSNHFVADPGFTQVNNFIWTPNWGSGGITDYFAYASGRTIVIQSWFKGTGPGRIYAKWTEMWYNGGTNPSGRIQMGIWYTHRNSSWHVNANGPTDRVAAQPVGPYPEIMTDNQWHRMTIAYKPNSSGYGQNPSSRDGLFRAWIDGTKIIDLSASAIGVTPPGGTWPWATGYNFNGSTYGPVDATGAVGAGLDWLPAGDSHQIVYIRFPDLANGTTDQLDLAWDDLKIWTTP